MSAYKGTRSKTEAERNRLERELAEYQRSLANAPGRGGMRINPRVQLDTSQIEDRRPAEDLERSAALAQPRAKKKKWWQL